MWLARMQRELMRLALAASLLLAVTQVSGAAGLVSQGGSYGAHVGYAKTRDADNGETLFGGHFEIDPVPMFGVQASVDYRSRESFLVPASGLQDKVEVRSIPVTLSGRIYLPAGGAVSPFLTAGAGWYRQTYHFSSMMHALGVEDETTSTFGWHLGLGLRMAAAEHVSLYGEARYVFLDPSRNLNEAVRQQMRDINYDSVYLAGGMSYHF